MKKLLTQRDAILDDARVSREPKFRFDDISKLRSEAQDEFVRDIEGEKRQDLRMRLLDGEGHSKSSVGNIRNAHDQAFVETLVDRDVAHELGGAHFLLEVLKAGSDHPLYALASNGAVVSLVI